jgi:hypothetical protein
MGYWFVPTSVRRSKCELIHSEPPNIPSLSHLYAWVRDISLLSPLHNIQGDFISIQAKSDNDNNVNFLTKMLIWLEIKSWIRNIAESPSLVLVINDTKLLMPLCQVNWVRRNNTCDEGARSMMVMAKRSQVHEDKDDGEHAHRWWTRNERIKAKV